MAKQMNWYNFEQTLRNKGILIFTPLDVKRIFHISKIAASFLLYRYRKRKFIVRLKRGLYAFASAENLNNFSIANKLYEPSYISLEFALSFHGIIPETVYEITSVTTKATRRFKVMGKIFSYRRIKKEAFTGYIPLRQNGITFFMAEPEKAFVDCLYFRIRRKLKFFDRFRQNKINKKKALRYARLFKNQALLKTIKKILLQRALL